MIPSILDAFTLVLFVLPLLKFRGQQVTGESSAIPLWADCHAKAGLNIHNSLSEL